MPFIEARIDKFQPAQCPCCGQETDYEIEWLAALKLKAIGFDGEMPWTDLPARMWVKCERCKAQWYEPARGADAAAG